MKLAQFSREFFFFFVSHYIISYIQNVLRNLWRKHVLFWYKNQEEKYHWLSKKNCDNLALFISSKSVWEGGLGAWHFVMSGLRFWLFSVVVYSWKRSAQIVGWNTIKYVRKVILIYIWMKAWNRSAMGHLIDDVFLLIRPDFISFFLSYLNLVAPVRFN